MRILLTFSFLLMTHIGANDRANHSWSFFDILTKRSSRKNTPSEATATDRTITTENHPIHPDASAKDEIFPTSMRFVEVPGPFIPPIEVNFTNGETVITYYFSQAQLNNKISAQGL